MAPSGGVSKVTRTGKFQDKSDNCCYQTPKKPAFHAHLNHVRHIFVANLLRSGAYFHVSNINLCQRFYKDLEKMRGLTLQPLQRPSPTQSSDRPATTSPAAARNDLFHLRCRPSLHVRFHHLPQ